MQTTKSWIIKARKIHNNNYNYIKSIYWGSRTKITITCPKHGDFSQDPSSHLAGHGCVVCQRENHKITYNDFINKSNKVHSNKYDYSKSKIDDIKTTIICPVHGEFQQLIRSHLSGKGCRKCANDNLKLTKDSFIKKASQKHNNKYNYSKIDEINYKKKIKIICPKHGTFEQSITQHLQGAGCQKCVYDGFKPSTDEFIQRAKLIHGNIYDYSKTEYVNSYTKVKIICQNHGVFEQIPTEHLRGFKCKACATDKSRLSIDEFVCRSGKIHNDKYNYSRVSFKNYYDDVDIICPKHGIYKQSVSNHVYGHGCPSCPVVISKGHSDIVEFIKTLYDGEIKVNDRQIIRPNELDIYLPGKMLGIEFNGNYFHSFDKIETPKERHYHQNKYEICKKNNIRLLQISENEWHDKQEIIKSKIKSLFGLNKIFARKCNIKKVADQEYIIFMDENHIQGHRLAKVKYGLYYNDELVACMSFNKKGEEWEIMRFANKLNISVVGGASRLFKNFISDNHPIKIISYADLRYSIGNMYYKLGFKLERITKPDYVYIKGKKVFSRYQFQKHKLKNKLGNYDPYSSESVNMFNNGFRRMWGAGNLKFLWETQNGI